MNDLNVHELWLLWELTDSEADCCDERPDALALIKGMGYEIEVKHPETTF
jgi:hypothetical protein